ncbi:serine hydrolase domain-containing protein [Aquimarina sp. 433]
MKSVVLSIVLGALLSLTASCQKNKKEVSIIETKLDSLYTQQFPNSNEPGGSVLIKKGDKTIFLGNYGVADLETGEKITEHTLFNTGSISKTFVSNGILILQEQGKLSIEDSIGKYFSDFKNKEIANRIQIKHWLSHTSGIPDVRKIREEREFYLTTKDTQNFAPLKQVDSLLFEPGEKFRYSNPSYNGLALIIDQLSGMPWQSFVKKEILEPAGMTQTKIVNGAYPQKGVAHGYVLENGKYQERDYGEEPTYAASGNSGVCSSVLELAKYEKALQYQVFLSKESIDASRTVWKPRNWNTKYKPFIGYSWFIGDESFLFKPNPYEVSFVYHTGSNGGYNSFYIAIPEKDLLLVGLFNQPIKEYNALVHNTISILQKHNWLD